MVNHVIDDEAIQHYDYEGKEYSIKLYYLEDQPIKAFASFQMNLMNDCETIVGFGEDHNVTNAIKEVKAIEE